MVKFLFLFVALIRCEFQYGARGLGWSLNFWTSLVGRIFSNKENPKMSASKVRT